MVINRRTFVKLLGLGLSAPALGFGKEQTELFLPKTDPRRLMTKFCFGSCNKHHLPQDHLSAIASLDPDLFIWLGDNVYGDTYDMNLLQSKYQSLKSNSHFYNLYRTCPMIGTWDDHDFGKNNAGAEFLMKEMSQQHFLDFFDVPKDSPRREQKGIYSSSVHGPAGQKVKFILLDLRYHKEKKNKKTADMLGQEQWTWLENEIKNSDASFHIFCSSIGVLKGLPFVEDWSDYPRSYKRFMDLIDTYRPSGTFFISGDKHFGARITNTYKGQRYYEWMSSGMTHSIRKPFIPVARFKYKKKNCYFEENFAQVLFDWEKSEPVMTTQILNPSKRVVLESRYQLSSGILRQIS
ncbi:MAG: alkaline phosphatase D family protein [Bacteriovoracaceae bacterium]